MSTIRARERAWVEVRTNAIRRNLQTVLDTIGVDGLVIPMVKANGYGLGVEGVVRAIESMDPWAFGVATVDEGVRLREVGVSGRVIVFSPIPPESVAPAVEASLTPTVSDLSSLEAFAEVTLGPTAIHLDIDTGMGRSGFPAESVDAWAPDVLRLLRGSSGNGKGGLVWEGCFTHFHSADDDPPSMAEQLDRFKSALDVLHPPADCLLHVANSAGVFRDDVPGRFAGPRRIARPGIFLYGGRPAPDLPSPEPVASVHARVVHVREAASGTPVGYGSSYRANGTELWATLGIGYGDGLPRGLGNRGHAIVKGRRVPIIGRISMDMTVVNISSTPGVVRGDSATLIGREGEVEITVDQVAEACGTISYEVLTGLTPRLPRLWIDG